MLCDCAPFVCEEPKYIFGRSTALICGKNGVQTGSLVGGYHARREPHQLDIRLPEHECSVAAILVLYAVRRDLRRSMFWVSAGTALLGLTEPLFVPRYWNPFTVFDLARRTGFDIESLVFSFAIGGIVFSAYDFQRICVRCALRPRFAARRPPPLSPSLSDRRSAAHFLPPAPSAEKSYCNIVLRY